MAATLLHRRRFQAAAVAAVACLFGTAARGAGRSEPRRLQIAMAGSNNLHYLPLTMASQLGYFEAEGLEVTLAEHSSSARALQAVNAGAADVACGPYAQALQMHSRSRPHEAFVLLAHTPAITVGVSSRSLPGIRTVADLRGRTLGISAPGSASDLVAARLLHEAGLSPQDVAIVSVGTPVAAMAALRAGQIDGLSHGEPLMTLLEQRAEIRVVGDACSLRGTRRLFGGSLPWSCLHASTDFIVRQPQLVQGVTHAVVRALKWLRQAGPRELLREVPESMLGGDRGLFLAAMQKLRESMSVDGVLPQEGARTALRALTSFESELGSGRIEAPRTYTNQFALRAKARFQA
ncbi:MAG: ABC transporter substrate-binding protein [Betaproteobacteria bacterium]|nr:ABC transporter substrate-binding protein [Betaproteobacteria bacterium]